MSEYMSRSTGDKVVKLLLIGMVVVLAMVAYTFYESHRGSAALLESQRNGCERYKMDRISNASGWRTAQAARTASVAEQMGVSVIEVDRLIKSKPKADDHPDLRAARRYNRVASDLEKRSLIDCKKAFPSAGWVP